MACSWKKLPSTMFRMPIVAPRSDTTDLNGGRCDQRMAQLAGVAPDNAQGTSCRRILKRCLRRDDGHVQFSVLQRCGLGSVTKQGGAHLQPRLREPAVVHCGPQGKIEDGARNDADAHRLEGGRVAGDRCHLLVERGSRKACCQREREGTGRKGDERSQQASSRPAASSYRTSNRVPAGHLVRNRPQAGRRDLPGL